ncbi:MAG: hypothetical protein CV081_03915 [Nitrospira sp. LK265]|nr:hypothetical protein [Nitrospira sp.]NGZ59638.1 hypothetical protein [Nitrospira sp. LK265]
MARFSYTRRLAHALLLLGTVNAGCATASLADGEKAQTPPSDSTSLETQLDPTTATQPQTAQEAPRQSSESETNVSAPTQPQTGDTAPGQSEGDEAAPVRPQNEIPAPVQPQSSETPPPQSPDTPPVAQPQTDNPPVGQPQAENPPAAQPQTDNPPIAQEEPSPPAPVLTEANPSIMLTGRVWRAKPGIVFLKTPIGLMSLSSKTTLKTLPASQEVFFWIHEDHVVVDIVKRTDGTLVHRYLTGPFKQDQADSTQLVGWTPEGEKAFHMGTFERALTSRKEGQSVTIEVDGKDTVIGVHDLQFDLQIGQVATNGSKAHLLLTGTISKLKSNFIFFRTPIGIVNVNAKIGIKNAKVGQILTLRVHDHHLVADLSSSIDSGPIRRFVTGPLEFADADRTSIRLWTPEGEQTYPTDLGKSALNGAKTGTPITVELDGQGDVVEFHRMK